MDEIDLKRDGADEVEVLRYIIERMEHAIDMAETRGYDELRESLRAVKQYAESLLGNPPSIKPQ